MANRCTTHRRAMRHSHTHQKGEEGRESQQGEDTEPNILVQRIVQALPPGPQRGLGHAELRDGPLVGEGEVVSLPSLREEHVVHSRHEGLPLHYLGGHLEGNEDGNFSDLILLILI